MAHSTNPATFQTVTIADYLQQIGKRPFVALPREEIDRLHASLEIYSATQDEIDTRSDLLQLGVFVVAHHNYTWLVNRKTGSDILTLGFWGNLIADRNGNLFLDDSIKPQAKKVFDDNVRLHTPYEVRLAGLLYDESTAFNRTHLCIVCICRMRQQGNGEPVNREFEIATMGNGEVLQKADQFDAWSRIVIANSNAV